MSSAICCLSDIGVAPGTRPDAEFLGRGGGGILIYNKDTVRIQGNSVTSFECEN